MNQFAHPKTCGTAASFSQITGSYLLLILLVLAFLAASPVYALDPGRSVSQYGHTIWRTADGELPGAPHAITQTTDGYLWIGTEVGVVRFDGVRFVPLPTPSGDTLCDCGITSLLGTRDGSLWIGTEVSVYRLKNGVLKRFPFRARVGEMLEDRDGAVWAAMSRVADPKDGILCRADDAAMRCYGEKDGIPVGITGLTTIADDGSGGLWLGAPHGVLHWIQGTVSTHFPTVLANAENMTAVQALNRRSDGSVLVGIGQGGNHLGLQQLAGNDWTNFQVPGANPSAWAVTTIQTDRAGGIWIGTVEDGIYHVHQQSADHYTQRNGLASNNIESFFEDREGNIWVASSLGIDRFRESPIVTFSALEGLSSDSVSAVFPTRDGGIWIGNNYALDYLKDDKKVFSLTGKDLMGTQTTALLVDHQDRLWYGIDTSLMVRENGRSQAVTRPDGKPLGVVISIVEDGEKNIWAVTTGRPQMLFRIQGAKVIESVPIPKGIRGCAMTADVHQGVWLGSALGDLQHYTGGKMSTVAKNELIGGFNGILAEPDGSMWGTSWRGLVRWQDNTMRVMDRHNGLPCDVLYSVVKDNAETLWLNAKCGLISISAAELKKWWEVPTAPVAFHLFGVFDGFLAGVTPFSPIVGKGPDGRLWFANDTSLQLIDPAHLPQNRLAPPVHIEAIVADRKSYTVADGLQLPALTKDIQFDYTAPSFVVPQKVRFRYMLEGHDTDWQEPGARRQAFYNDLRPSNYRFRVIASNNDGLWNESGASFSFSIAPAYYQTTWFHFLVVVASAIVLYVVYQIRVRQIAAGLTARFDERTAERTRLAAELHDTILQSIQATKMIADNARHGGSQEPTELSKTIVNISDWLAQATAEARAALNDLRLSTTEKNDLAKAFQRAAESTGVTNTMKFVLSVQGTPRDLHPIVRDEIYRIGGEAIRNAYRHSEATVLEFMLIYDQGLTIRVIDNGKGMDADVAGAGKPGHFGLLGMQERACRIHARLDITSRANSGTEVTLVVPGKVVFAEENGNKWQYFLNKLAGRFLHKRPAKDDGKG